MKAKKTLALVLAFVLVAAVSVAATLAYLTAKSEQVTNTFTVGKIKIDLNEHDADGELTKSRTYEKVMPGDVLAKDPFVTVEAGSEECYVYVRILFNLTANMQPAGTLNIDEDKWKLVPNIYEDQLGGYTALYRYYEPVDASDGKVDLPPIFSTVTIKDTLTETAFNEINNDTIVVSAYAHQAANVTVEQADAAAKAWGLPNGGTA